MTLLGVREIVIRTAAPRRFSEPLNWALGRVGEGPR